jgi:1,4-alpha-glucan branching enzyme
MLNDRDLADLLAAQHADPFACLGLHAESDGRLWLRALLPGAVSVEVLDAVTGKPLKALALRHADGLFEAAIPRRRNRFDYRLRIDWGHSRTELADAYAFGPQLAEHDLQQLQSGLHPEPYGVLGAHALTINGVAGVRFAVWAPNARRVSVVGSFNVWDGRRHSMRLRHEAGVWEIFIPHVVIGDLYQFEILDASGQLLPHKADPYARASELRPGKASRVVALPAPTPLTPARIAANRQDAAISVYEVHAGSWKRRADGGFPSWDELAESLPAYAAGLGFTHLQLMPISEHPFDGSWGYQTLGLFAPSARFGEPEGFGRFVAACHRHDLGLLLDWVPAHFPIDAHGLARFDGSALYEYADPREGWHHDWNTAIYNFGRHEVRNFLVASARYWLERWGVDGLRVDAVASMLYRDYSRKPGQWLPNAHGGRENLEAISLFQRLNTEIGARDGALTIAEESTAFPGVTAPVHAGGLGFHFKWNMGWMNDSLRYMHEDPIHRRWHHDKITFSLVYAFSENFMLPLSHDEVVHGKGSLLGKMPGDAWQRFANLRAYYGFMWGHPGKKLLFMGQEFAQPNEWQHDAELPWHLLDEPAHAGVQHLIRDLNALYRAHPALHAKDCQADGFQWLNGGDAENSVLSWLRYDGRGGQVMVLSNLTPVPREAYRVGLPEGACAHWREALNTDSRHYGGTDVGNTGGVLHAEALQANGHMRSLAITLPPLSTVFLVPAE